MKNFTLSMEKNQGTYIWCVRLKFDKFDLHSMFLVETLYSPKLNQILFFTDCGGAVFVFTFLFDPNRSGRIPIVLRSLSSPSSGYEKRRNVEEVSSTTNFRFVCFLKKTNLGIF